MALIAESCSAVSVFVIVAGETEEQTVAAVPRRIMKRVKAVDREAKQTNDSKEETQKKNVSKSLVQNE